MFQDNDVTFCGNDIWSGNSPDLNAAEYVGSIINDEIEKNAIRSWKQSFSRSNTQKPHWKCFKKHGRRHRIIWNPSVFVSISASCRKERRWPPYQLLIAFVKSWKNKLFHEVIRSSFISFESLLEKVFPNPYNLAAGYAIFYGLSFGIKFIRIGIQNCNVTFLE